MDSKQIAAAFLMGCHIVVDALIGYPKEHVVYPGGKHVRIRHAGGLWELKPVYTYRRRALSPFKTNYRYGWNVVTAPADYIRFQGTDNLTEDPGRAISNMLEGELILRNYRDSNISA